MPRRPRLMYLATSSGTGGAERQVRDLSVRMHGMGWDVTAVSMLPLASGFAELPALGIATRSLGMSRGAPDPRGLLRLATFMRSDRPDVLHAHMVHANLLARVSRLVRRTQVVVCTMHSQYQGPRWRMLAYRATDRLCDVTTAVSEVARDEAIRLGAAPGTRISVVPNGVDLSRFGPDDGIRVRLREELGLRDEFTFLAVGRIFEAKDYPNLVLALARVLAVHAGGRVLIAGGGPQGELRSLIDRHHLTRSVQLLGERADVPDLMRAADAYVMSSAWEGLPLVLLEAGASGLPIVATDVGGNREAVEDRMTGFIVRPRDPEALARGMLRMMEMSSAERSAMGRAGRASVVARYDIDIVARRWADVYASVLVRRTRRSSHTGRSSI